MQRIESLPRTDWRTRVEAHGLVFHTTSVPYWDESAYYSFSAGEIDDLERATNEIHTLALAAVQHVIDAKRYVELGIPPAAIPLIERSWEDEPPAIYGRVDLCYDGTHPPKLLEYNADTPTALLEAAVIQWHWLQDVAPTKDQFNSIHERLIAAWKDLASYLPGGALHVVSMDNWEDAVTAAYMRDTAEQGGVRSRQLGVGQVGWDARRATLVDVAGDPMQSVFKLYPWEWMVADEFGSHLLESYGKTLWIEPAWKLVLSSKGILPVLWELNPGHPNLLESYFQADRLREYARKPLFSREGANVTLVADGSVPDLGHDGGYGAEGFVYQELAPLPTFDGKRPVIGSWLIQGEAAGIGIRESFNAITDNSSSFVPHLFEP